MDLRALFAFCLVGILLVALGCTGSSPPASAPAKQTTDQNTNPAPSAPSSPTPMPGSDRDAHGCIPSAGYSWCEPLQQCIRSWETNCTAPAAPSNGSNNALPALSTFVNTRCTLSAPSGDLLMLFKDSTHFKTEVSKNGQLLSTSWLEGKTMYILVAGQKIGFITQIANTASSANETLPEGMPADAKYECTPTSVSSADVTHPSDITFVDMSQAAGG